MERKLAIVLGLGEIGGPIFHLLSDAYGVTEVRGYDPLKEINPPSPGEVFEFMHICYPQTPGFHRHLRNYVKQYDPKCIIIHSTLHPGTMRILAEEYNIIANAEYPGIIYSPVRGNIREGMRQCLQTYTKFAAAAYNYGSENMEAVLSHLSGAGMPAREAESPASLEYAKLFNLAYYGTCIAVFQEIERIVEANALNYSEIKEFIFSTERESGGKVPRPVYYGGYIGGHCVIPAMEKLVAAHDSELFKAVIHSNIRRERELMLK